MKTLFLLPAFCLLLIPFWCIAQEPSADDDIKRTIIRVKGEHTQVAYYDSLGKMVKTGFYRGDKMDKTWISFDENGERKQIAQFREGVKDGTWLVWDAEGYLRYKILYVKDKVDKVYELNKQGLTVAER